MVARPNAVLWLTLLLGLTLGGVGAGRLLAMPPTPQIGTVPAVHTGPDTASARAEPSASEAEPSRVVLPTVGVDAAVRPESVQPDGQLAVPGDPHVVGWWAQGARPGSARGTVVLAGHVDTARDGAGALFHLGRLEPGAVVVLKTASGSLTYVVQAVRSYPKAALPVEVFDRSGAPRLVLITCGGSFDRRTRHYADNIVVYALPYGL